MPSDGTKSLCSLRHHQRVQYAAMEPTVAYGFIFSSGSSASPGGATDGTEIGRDHETPERLLAQRVDAEIAMFRSLAPRPSDFASDPLMYWCSVGAEATYSHLSWLAQKVFLPPASSAPVERAFSAAGYILSPRRRRLHWRRLNDFFCVHRVLAVVKVEMIIIGSFQTRGKVPPWAGNMMMITATG